MRTVSPLFLLACLLLSGCAATSNTPRANAGFAPGADQVCLQGVVVDEELVPVAEAAVSSEKIGASTDAEGKFKICPIQSGDYQLTITKAGYAPATSQASVGDQSVTVTITLRAIALNVPYHLSQHHVTFVNCASYNPIGGLPCTKLPDYVLGTNVSTEERFSFTFRITNDGLADMLVEMTWTAQQLGKDMLFYIQTPPGQPLNAASLNVKYFCMSGGNPLRGWVTHGIQNKCGTTPAKGTFDGSANKVTYEGDTVWSDGNATIPRNNNPVQPLSGVSVYVNHRTETWLTMFYNRAGSHEFTALADK
jgi:hypothetical protein